MKHYNIEQRTPEWDDLRLGKITASKAHVLYMKKDTKGYQQYRFKLAYERLIGEQMPEKWNGNNETEKGQEAEQYGIEQYEAETFRKVHDPGFYEVDDWVGCSPDGLVSKDGLLEVKALTVGNTFREKILKDFAIDTDQYEQCMFQLMVTGRQFVDLVYIPPTEKAKIQIQRIKRDEEYISDMWQRVEVLKQDVQEEMETLKKYLK